MNNRKIIFDNIFSNVFAKVLWSIIGLMAAVLTIYTFFQEKQVDLQYEIIANTNVLEVNAQISKLDILYDSTSLKDKNENLKLVNIKIINKGNKDILKEFFDEKDPIGIRIESGQILENPEIIETSNEYLQRNLIYSLPNDSSITFDSIIIEPGEYFILKLLILHRLNEEPQIYSIGKIAGQRVIEIKLASEVSDNISYVNKTFGGNQWIQISRLIFYFIIGIGLILFIAFLSDRISTIVQNKKKRELVIGFKKSNDYNYSKIDDAIFDRFHKSGAWILKDMSELTSNETFLNVSYKKALKKVTKGKDTQEFRYRDQFFPVVEEINDWLIINSMINDGLLFKDNRTITINKSMHKTLNKFITYLNEKIKIKRYSFLSFQKYFNDKNLFKEHNLN